jgi:penicillin-binding protein-related factor A (putative recombinase)
MAEHTLFEKESKIKDKIKKILKANNVFYFMPQSGIYGRAGIADFICCYNGYFVAIEAKSSTGKQRGLQALSEKQIKASMGVYLLVNDKNVDDLILLITRAMVENDLDN